MQFRIIVKNVNSGNEWHEDYNKPEVVNQESAEREARRIVAYFNSTLRPNESAREIVRVLFGEGIAKQPHEWEKQNAMTVTGKNGSYDIMKCKFCGVTGKRFGLGIGGVTLDHQFKAKAFMACDTAKKLLERGQQHDPNH